jgi:Protein of unknown function (DUF2971)
LVGKDLPFYRRPFVASFSQEDDSLPLWRSYCPNGNGVAVGFRVDCLKRAFVEVKDGPNLSDLSRKTPRVHYEGIEYLNDSALQSLDEAIDAAVFAATALANTDPEGGGHDRNTLADYFKFVVERLACFKKHPSFSNEREYRLLVNAVYLNCTYLEFRASRSTLVPYISVRIPRMHSSYSAPTDHRAPSALAGRWDFIDRVVIGPTANKDLSLDAVRSFFQRQLMNVMVVASSIPYRDW